MPENFRPGTWRDQVTIMTNKERRDRERRREEWREEEEGGMEGGGGGRNGGRRMRQGGGPIVSEWNDLHNEFVSFSINLLENISLALTQLV
eukprot:754582-Hanusia_phi.AAC.11